jgi:hypothetical protein
LLTLWFIAPDISGLHKTCSKSKTIASNNLLFADSELAHYWLQLCRSDEQCAINGFLVMTINVIVETQFDKNKYVYTKFLQFLTKGNNGFHCSQKLSNAFFEETMGFLAFSLFF